MHTVTKVLVVFAAVLCVLLAALTMAYSVNADRITANYRDQVNARQLAEANASADITQARAQLAAEKEKFDQLNQRYTDLSNQNSALQADIANRKSELARAQQAADANTAQLDQLAATTKTQATIIDTYRGEVTKLRDNELAYRKREIEITDRNNDLESQVEVKDSSIRALQEQLAEMKRTVDSRGLDGTGPANAAGGPYKPGIPISGRILSVGKNAANQKPVATINVGANNQVKENMELAITRGGVFLANFVVTKTDLQWSVGEINTLGNKNVEIREGDQVGTLVSR